MPDKQIKVLVIDDSALIRALLTEVLNSDPRLSVVASATDPYEARELIKVHAPDVLTLDIEMPKMNGLAFLKNLMRLRPMPVVMISTLTQDGAPATLEALEMGAIDFVPKPKSDDAQSLEKYREVIIEKVAGAARANIQAADKVRASSSGARLKSALPAKKPLRPMFICAIGASTGGTEAIKSVISALPPGSPPIVIAQHIPEVFSTSFARRVDECSQLNVYEAEHNQAVEKDGVYIAPGHSHLRIMKHGGKYICKLDQGEPVHRHRPSVTVLFDSVRQCADTHAMGVLLTGMGADGADALLRLRENACYTVAQDEATSVVWGMPGAAVKMGAAEKILPLNKVPKCIIEQAYK